MRKVKPLREFEVGEIIHILAEEPPEEKITAAGCKPLGWVDETRKYAGQSGIITNRFNSDEQYGFRYKVEFKGTTADYYGVDFREFYEEQKSVLTPEALITLLG